MEPFACPICNQALWFKPSSPARVRCPKCLGVIPNPHARLPPVIEPKDALPVDEDVFNDYRGTIRALGIFSIVLIGSAIAAATQRRMDLVFVGLMIAGVIVAAIASWIDIHSPKVYEYKMVKLPEAQEALPTPANPPILEYAHRKRSNPPSPDTPVLDYGQRRYRYKTKEPGVSMGAFVLGFFAAIGLGAVCFFGLAGTIGDLRRSPGEGLFVFTLVLAALIGLIIGALRVGRNPDFNGFGRGVATGLVLAMMALGPCAFCYLGELLR